MEQQNQSNQAPGQNTEPTRSNTFKMLSQNRGLIPTSFALVLVFFCLSFCDINCGGQRLATVKGIEFVTGKDIPTPTITGQESKSEKLPPNPFAIIAFAAACIGLGVYLVRIRKEAFLGTVSGTVGVISLLLLQYTVTSKISEQSKGQAEASFLFGYWACVLAFVSATALSYLRKDITQTSTISIPFFKKIHPIKLAAITIIALLSAIGYFYYCSYKLEKDRITVLNETFKSSGFSHIDLSIYNLGNDVNGIDEYAFSCSVTNETKNPLYIKAEQGKSIVTKVPPYCTYSIKSAKAHFKKGEAYSDEIDKLYEVSDGSISKYGIEGEWVFDSSNDAYNVFNSIQIFSDQMYMNVSSEKESIGYNNYSAAIKSFPDDQIFRINYDFSCCDVPRGSMYQIVTIQLTDDLNKLQLSCDNFNGKKYIAYFKRKTN